MGPIVPEEWSWRAPFYWKDGALKFYDTGTVDIMAGMASSNKCILAIRRINHCHLK